MDPEESPWADSAAPPAQPTDEPPSQASTTKSPSAGAARGPRITRRLVAQPTRLSAVDDPLGPLGSAASSDKEAPPAPPQKEVVMRTTMQGAQAEGARGPRDPHDVEGEEEEVRGEGEGEAGRAPPPVMEASPTVRSGSLPSVSVEDAAKVSFHITVGDPHKVGDLTSSHIVYSVRTKVRSSPFSPRSSSSTL